MQGYLDAGCGQEANRDVGGPERVEAQGFAERVLQLFMEMGFQKISHEGPELAELVALAKRWREAIQPLHEVEEQWSRGFGALQEAQLLTWLGRLRQACTDLEALGNAVRGYRGDRESQKVLDSMLQAINGDKARVESFARSLQAWLQQRVSAQIAEAYRLLSMPGELGQAQEMLAKTKSDLEQFPDWPVSGWKAVLSSNLAQVQQRVEAALQGDVETLFSQAEQMMLQAESATDPYTALTYSSWARTALEKIRGQQGRLQGWTPDWDGRLSEDDRRFEQLQTQIRNKTQEWTKEQRLELAKRYVREYQESGEQEKQKKADFLNILLAFDPELEGAIADLSMREQLRHRREDQQKARALYHEAKGLWEAEGVRKEYLWRTRTLLEEAWRLDPECQEIAELKQLVETECGVIDQRVQALERRVEEVERLFAEKPDAVEEIRSQLQKANQDLNTLQKEASEYGPHPSPWELRLDKVRASLEGVAEKQRFVDDWYFRIRSLEMEWQKVADSYGVPRRDLLRGTVDLVQDAPPQLPTSLWKGLAQSVRKYCNSIRPARQIPDGIVWLAVLERKLADRCGGREESAGTQQESAAYPLPYSGYTT